MKKISAGAILQAYFSHSLTLAKQITKPEHRANPFVNILNTTTKSTQQYPDLLGEKTMFWRFCHSLTGAGSRYGALYAMPITNCRCVPQLTTLMYCFYRI